MSDRLPVGFILASHAATCDPSMVSYGQLWQEVQAGSIVIDANLSHKGVWLLDHAIKLRMASNGGLRAFRANRGADPSMDALWERWFSLGDEVFIGGKAEQSMRVAALIRVGSSRCLGEALKRGVSPSLVRDSARSMQSPALYSDPLVYCVKEDLLGTARELLQHGFLDFDFPPRAHPLQCVRSADMLALLLEHGADPRIVPSPGLIDVLLSRDIAVVELEKMLVLLGRHPALSSTPEDHCRRIASNLGKKSLGQLKVEMRTAGWSPRDRANIPSPIVAWAKARLADTSSIGTTGSAALSLLVKHASVCKPQDGEPWSEAAWIWAAVFACHPREAEEFAKVAVDIPSGQEYFERFGFFEDFLRANDLPRVVERAIASQFSELQWSVPEQDRAEQAKKRLDCWVGDGTTPSLMTLFVSPPPSRARDVMGWVKFCEGDPVASSQWMALACWIGIVQKDPELMGEIEDRWHAGMRPLAAMPIVKALGDLTRGHQGLFPATVNAWALEQSCAMPSSMPRPSPRL